VLEVTEGPLVERVARIGTQCKCPVDHVHLAEFQGRSNPVQVTLWQRKVFITQKAVDSVSDSALDFGIARELSHPTIYLNVTVIAGVLIGFGIMRGLLSNELPSALEGPLAWEIGYGILICL